MLPGGRPVDTVLPEDDDAGSLNTVDQHCSRTQVQEVLPQTIFMPHRPVSCPQAGGDCQSGG